MYRIKLGPHITIGNISRGSTVVLECEHINEVVDLIKSGVLDHLVEVEREMRPKAGEVIREL